ncbi:MAG: hypothetical protein ACRCSZ_08820, partial [Lactococcus lactis]
FLNVSKLAVDYAKQIIKHNDYKSPNFETLSEKNDRMLREFNKIISNIKEIPADEDIMNELRRLNKLISPKVAFTENEIESSSKDVDVAKGRIVYLKNKLSKEEVVTPPVFTKEEVEEAVNEVMEEANVVEEAPQAEEVSQNVEESDNIEAARDATKPEQMTPIEVINAGSKSRVERRENKSVLVIEKETGKTIREIQRKTVSKLNNAKYEARELDLSLLKTIDPRDDNGWQGNVKQRHEQNLKEGLTNSKPVSSKAIDTYGIKLPEGYVKQGELYVYQPETVGRSSVDFSMGEPRQSDAKYLELAKDPKGNRHELQKMVDNYSKKPNFYRGQLGFLKKYPNSNKGFLNINKKIKPTFWTSSQNIASLYARQGDYKSQYESSEDAQKGIKYWEYKEEAIWFSGNKKNGRKKITVNRIYDKDKAKRLKENGIILNEGYEPYKMQMVQKAKVYLKNPLLINANGALWNDINFNEKKLSTDEIAIIAYNSGYDGVEIKNVKDSFTGMSLEEISTILISFNSNQVKSADPVTYDEQGNVIPLSQRFNERSDSINFSMGARKTYHADVLKSLFDAIAERQKSPYVDNMLMQTMAEKISKFKRDTDRTFKAFGKEYTQKALIKEKGFEASQEQQIRRSYDLLQAILTS